MNSSNPKSTILVTGGAGFIGSALVRHLIHDTNYAVVNVDKLTYAGHLDSIESVKNNARYAFEQIDICDAHALQRVFKKYQPNLIMHLAAESHVDRSINNSSVFIQTNIVGTHTLLEQARIYWDQLEGDKQANFRFHHVSTDEVYGDLPHPDDQPNYEQKKGKLLPLFTEQSPYAPSSPYSASKASSDHLVRAWHRTYGLPIIITNCSNNYGPYQFPEKLIPLTILNALKGECLPVYGKGNQIRDWLYVEDHANALKLVLDRGKIGEDYNIGGHNEKRNIEVVETICAKLDTLKPSKEGSYMQKITFVKDRPGHDMRYAIDANKIKNELGWQPQETFESGIEKTILWYLDNINWCNQVSIRNQLQKRRTS